MSVSSEKLRSYIQSIHKSVSSDRPVIKATIGYAKYFPKLASSPSARRGSFISYLPEQELESPRHRNHHHHHHNRAALYQSTDPRFAQSDDDVQEALLKDHMSSEGPNPVPILPFSRGEDSSGCEREYEIRRRDDKDGSYRVEPGETLDDERYLVKAVIGKGSFSTVVTAVDRANLEVVAIKIIRSKGAYFRQGCIEASILQRVEKGDKDHRHHLVHLRHFFQHGQHLCLVFELLSYNLYELLTISHFQGVTLNLVRKFGTQILETLEYLSSPAISVVHGDIKPENILLVSSKHSAVKISDFGSAAIADDGNVPYAYVQSRYYRAPEILMGLSYSFPIDMWSLGCVLVEMHIGVPLFRGANDADQLVRIAEYFGLPPVWMIRSSRVAHGLFTRAPGGSGYSFLPKIEESMTRKSLEDLLGAEIGGPNGSRIHEPGHTPADYAKFIDVIRRMLAIDPVERIKPHEALMHPFFHAGVDELHRTRAAPSISSPVLLQPSGSPRVQYPIIPYPGPQNLQYLLSFGSPQLPPSSSVEHDSSMWSSSNQNIPDCPNEVQNPLDHHRSTLTGIERRDFSS